MAPVRRFAGLPATQLPGGLTLVEAASQRSRARGLGGLRTLPPDLALEIPTSAVHTFTMRFALDLIWRDDEGHVLRVDRDVPRWHIRRCATARSVIETAAGRADAFTRALGES